MRRAGLTEPAAYVACRTLGHAWDDIPVTADIGRSPRNGAAFLRLRCTRCATERLDEVSRSTGEVEGRRYGYPDGYRHSAEDSLERTEWRWAYMRLVGAITDRRTNGGN